MLPSSTNNPRRNADANDAPRWERRKEARPQELLAAALDLFVERGFAATRLDDVAAKAGVSKGTLYLYFDNKQDLFEAVVRNTIVVLIEALAGEFETRRGRVADSVRWYFDRWWSVYGSTQLAAILKLLIGEAGNFPDIARFFRAEVIEPNAALLQRIIERGVASGEFVCADPAMTARLWMAPLVLKSIWIHSFDSICGGGSEMDIARFRAAHAEHALASVGAGSR